MCAVPPADDGDHRRLSADMTSPDHRAGHLPAAELTRGPNLARCRRQATMRRALRYAWTRAERGVAGASGSGSAFRSSPARGDGAVARTTATGSSGRGCAGSCAAPGVGVSGAGAPGAGVAKSSQEKLGRHAGGRRRGCAAGWRRTPRPRRRRPRRRRPGRRRRRRRRCCRRRGACACAWRWPRSRPWSHGHGVLSSARGGAGIASVWWLRRVFWKKRKRSAGL